MNDEAVPEFPLEKKIGDLLLKGWTLLADHCFLDTCRTPLMKSLDGQKYCVGCEMWVCDKENPKKQKFHELVSLNGKQNVQLKNKNSEIQKLSKGSEIKVENNIVATLQIKLIYLNTLLSKESNVEKIREIIETMRNCMDAIKEAKALI